MMREPANVSSSQPSPEEITERGSNRPVTEQAEDCEFFEFVLGTPLQRRFCAGLGCPQWTPAVSKPGPYEAILD
jgi:hypothetical protein